MGYQTKVGTLIFITGLLIALLYFAAFGRTMNWWMLLCNMFPLVLLFGLSYLGCRKYPAMAFWFTTAALVFIMLFVYAPLLARPWGNGPDPGLIFIFAPINQLIILAVFILT